MGLVVDKVPSIGKSRGSNSLCRRYYTRADDLPQSNGVRWSGQLHHRADHWDCCIRLQLFRL